MNYPSTPRVVTAQPYDYIYDPAHTALVVIDMQRDFVEPGGFGAALGNDVSPLAQIVPTVARLLAFARREGWTIVHTRESHLPDLSDCPPAKRLRGNPSLRIGDPGPMGRILVRGEPGNDIVDAVRPLEGEIVIDKPGKGAFYGTALQPQLQEQGVTHLVFAGVTTEVCVQTSMREANDRGYECLLVEDATASYFPAFKSATIAMLHAQGGIVGWTAPLSALEAELAAPSPAPCGGAVNLPHVVAQLRAAFDAYETALVRHEVTRLDDFFWYDPQTVRYGVAENLYGGEEIRRYRMACRPVHPQRRIERLVITTFGEDFATVAAEFSAPDTEANGRQLQTWARFAEGWRVVAAHVSLI
jgi:nicotinamidase-related amidase